MGGQKRSMVMADIRLCRLAELLTTEILIEILIRLPLESVLVCRKVCKSWNHLILQPFFADLHRTISPLTLMAVHHSSKTKPSHGLPQLDLTTFLLKTGESSRSSCKTSFTGTVIPQNSHLEIVGSCNGVICLYSYSPIRYGLFMFNPILETYFILPDPPQMPQLVSSSRLGFGYIPSTGQYKAVKIGYMEDRDQTWLLFHVCTIQKKSSAGRNMVGKKRSPPPSVSAWRTIYYDSGSLSRSGLPRLTDWYSYSTYFKGSIIWIAESRNKKDCHSLIYFDIEKEEMHTLSLPFTVPTVNHSWFEDGVRVGVYYDDNGDDHLYLCEKLRNCSKIWVMEDDNCINSLKLKWVVKLNIWEPSPPWLLKVLPDGKLLVVVVGVGDASLAYYDPKRGGLDTVKNVLLPFRSWAVDVPNLLGCFL